MPDLAMAAIKDLCVDPVELPHPAGEIRLGRLDQQMIVIVHQTIGMAEPAKTTDHLTEDGQPSLPICIDQDDALARIAATGHMVDCVGEFNAKGPSHGERA
jgi:hypothetical protein